jgi:hypothetical protein
MSENIIRAVIVVALRHIGSLTKPGSSKGFSRLPNNKEKFYGALEENYHLRIQPQCTPMGFGRNTRVY